MEATRTVALVIPAHRAGPDLDACLGSVALLDPAPDEVVVVVDGGDAAVSSAVDRQLTGASVIAIAPSGPATARNRGARASSSQVILFVDSDCTVQPDLVTRVRSAMSEPGRDALIGSYDDQPAAPGLVSRFRNLVHHRTHHLAAGRGHTFWGACGAIERVAFEAVGGFDESYCDATIEDIELGERLTSAGCRIDVVPTIQITHLKRWTLRSMIHTDFSKRGVPWTRLMLRSGSMSNDLNTTRKARITVGFAGVLVAALAASVLAPSRARVSAAVAAGSAAAITWQDRDMLGFLRQVRGLGFAARCVPLLWIHHVTAGAAFFWAVATWPLDRRR